MNAAEVARVARWAAGLGWMPATSGNVSVRAAPDRVLVTATGLDKREIDASGVVTVDLRGNVVGGGRASAETRLHLARYAAEPRVGAVVHVHAPRAVRISRRFVDAVVLEGFELLKAFDGVRTHEARVVVPIVDNHQDMDVLAPLAEAAVARAHPTWGYLVRGHGLYTWGADLRDAARHAEALDALFDYVLAELP